MLHGRSTFSCNNQQIISIFITCCDGSSRRHCEHVKSHVVFSSLLRWLETNLFEEVHNAATTPNHPVNTGISAEAELCQEDNRGELDMI